MITYKLSWPLLGCTNYKKVSNIYLGKHTHINQINESKTTFVQIQLHSDNFICFVSEMHIVASVTDKIKDQILIVN